MSCRLTLPWPPRADDPADSLEVMDLKIQLWTEMIKHLETQQNWIRSDLKELVKKYKEAKKKYDKEQKEEAPL